MASPWEVHCFVEGPVKSHSSLRTPLCADVRSPWRPQVRRRLRRCLQRYPEYPVKRTAYRLCNSRERECRARAALAAAYKALNCNQVCPRRVEIMVGPKEFPLGLPLGWHGCLLHRKIHRARILMRAGMRSIVVRLSVGSRRRAGNSPRSRLTSSKSPASPIDTTGIISWSQLVPFRHSGGYLECLLFKGSRSYFAEYSSTRVDANVVDGLYEPTCLLVQGDAPTQSQACADLSVLYQQNGKEEKAVELCQRHFEYARLAAGLIWTCFATTCNDSAYL